MKAMWSAHNLAGQGFENCAVHIKEVFFVEFSQLQLENGTMVLRTKFRIFDLLQLKYCKKKIDIYCTNLFCLLNIIKDCCIRIHYHFHKFHKVHWIASCVILPRFQNINHLEYLNVIFFKMLRIKTVNTLFVRIVYIALYKIILDLSMKL